MRAPRYRNQHFLYQCTDYSAHCPRNEPLTSALTHIGLPLSSLPRPVTRLILQLAVTTPRLLIPASARARVASSPEGCAALVRDRPQAAALLAYCLSDIDERDAESVRQLIGVPLVPLADGSLGVIGGNVAGSSKMFVVVREHTDLLRGQPRFLVDSTGLGQEMMAKCASAYLPFCIRWNDIS